MANPQQLARLKKGVDIWNEWRREALPEKVNLSSATFSNADLSEVNLTHANLSRVDLVGADLSDADLSFADLSDSDLSEANLSHSRMLFVNLSRTNLSKANLTSAFLCGSNLDAATLQYTVFADTDLRETSGLDSVDHHGPSSIGIDTFFRSKGAIPDAFLRGAGVPDAFITYAKSLVGSVIEFYSCFISYSTTDQEFADRLYTDLQAKGVRCWFAPHDVHGGRKLHEQIDDAIRVHQKLLLILSPHSIKSAWVESEIRRARKRERQ
jgi:hypothetical protein